MQIKRRITGDVLFESDADSMKACLEAAVYKKINLGGADLGGADLGGASLAGAFLSGANLKNTNLGSANLTNASLWSADLMVADLTHADLMGADLCGVDFCGAILEGADTTGADIMGAKGIIRIGPSVGGDELFAIQNDDFVMIKTPRRWFSLQDAEKHWKDDARPEIGDQRRRWLKFIKAEAKALGWTI